MHYLIDGHNLIGKVPDIDLDDPYDEARLILKVRQWAAGGRKRRVTLYFDGGLPGGLARGLSSGPVQVVFASLGQSADALLIRQINKARNPVEYTLVSSDRQVAAAAAARKMPVVSAEAFAAQLPADRDQAGAAGAAVTEPEAPGDDPAISPEEVAEWLELFGPEPEPTPPSETAGAGTKAGQGAEPGPARGKGRKRKQPLVTAKQPSRKLNPGEIAAWLELFEQGAAERPSTSVVEPDAGEPSPKPPKSGRPARPRRSTDAQPAPRTPNQPLSDADLAAWLEAFGDEDSR